METLISKKTTQLFLLILLLPLFFIDINAFHNWGDDFAQYLCQAANIVNGKSFRENPIYDAQNIGPLNRGAGFSLLLSPFYAMFALSMPVYFLLMSALLILCGIVLFRFFHQSLPFKAPQLIALLLVLIVVYNRHVLFLKTEILPVFPMMALLYYCFYISREPSPRRQCLVAICSGLLLSLANLSWVFYLACMLMQFIHLKNHFSKSALKQSLVLLLSPLLIYALIKSIVFKTLITDDISWYHKVFSFHSLLEVVQNNLKYYKDIFFLSFDQDIWFVLNKGIKLLMLLLVLSGFYYKVKNKFQIEDVFFVCYLILLLVYPDNGSGIRFLMPLIPLILLYSAFGCRFLLDVFTIPKWPIASILYLCILLTYFQNIQQTIKSYAQLSEGPYEAEAKAAYQFIRDSTDQHAAVAFCKPWTIKLYTQRAAMPVSSKQNFEDIQSTMQLNRVEYILLSLKNSPPEIYHANALQNIRNNSNFRCVYSNKNFMLFRYIP